VIDLRGNGGGALTEAISLSGLFIPSGPVVQVRDNNGRVRQDFDKDDVVYYKGPLVVIVNRFSASASEIFAAAMQDYGRALIVGEQTFGKGTV
ncbi:tail-specific protease, partial [Staphylococcus aureus]